jgi:hypothetical protein
MKKLSAAEAIGPAWEHTRMVMCVPYRWQRYLKLGFVALIAQMAASGFSAPMNVPGMLKNAAHVSGLGGMGGGFGAMTSGITAAIVLMTLSVMLVVFVIGMVLFYIASRMQFVLFNVVATRQSTIRAIWKKYSMKTWRWIGLKLLFAVCCVVVMGIILIATLPFLIAGVMHLSHSGDTSNVVGEVGTGLVVSIIALILGILFFAVVYAIISTLLHDFTLPYIALEDLRIGAALRRLEIFVKDSPGEVILYLLLKLALYIALALVGDIFFCFAFLFSMVPFAVVGVPLYFLLHGHGTIATVLLVAAAGVGGLLLLAWIFILGAAIFGYVYVFMQSYALYFMGGRYQQLGDLLEPPVAPPAVPTPVTT